MNVSQQESLLEWGQAVANVLACALSERLKAIARGASPSDVYSEEHIRTLVQASFADALVGFSHHASARCMHLRCREEALVVAVSSKEAKMTGRPIEEVELESLAKLYEWMDGRN